MKNLSNVLFYTFLEGMNKAIPFLLIPVYTRVLSKEDYALIEVFNLYLSAFTLLVFFNSNTYFQTRYYDFFKKQVYLVSYPVLVVLINILALSLPFYLFVPESAFYIYFIPIYALFFFYLSIQLIDWQMREEKISYFTVQISMTVINMVVSLVLILQFESGGEGRIWAVLLAPVAIFCFFMPTKALTLYKKRPKKIELQVVKDIYLFGAHLLPYNLLNGWLRDNVARLYLLYSSQTLLLGTWAVVFNYAFVTNVIVNAVNLALAPRLIKSLSNQDLKDFVKLMFMGAMFFVILISCSTVFLIYSYNIFIGEQFHFDTYVPVVSTLCLGFFFNGVSVMVAHSLNYFKLPHYLSFSSMISVFAYIVMIVSMETSALNIAISYTASFACLALINSAVLIYKILPTQNDKSYS